MSYDVTITFYCDNPSCYSVKTMDQPENPPMPIPEGWYCIEEIKIKRPDSRFHQEARDKHFCCIACTEKWIELLLSLEE